MLSLLSLLGHVTTDAWMLAMPGLAASAPGGGVG
jgi:hypothetical protein